MSNRRSFLKKSALLGSSVIIAKLTLSQNDYQANPKPIDPTQTIFLSTWNHGLPANEEAMNTINSGGQVLDAVENGVKIIESDVNNASVGIGGTPDRDGHVTLDASIMDGEGNAGAVCFLEGFEHPISVARKVMENTPHVLLAGEGAAQFAREQGFKEIDLLTENAKKEWEKWKIKSEYKPVINIENHDTIGMLGMHQGAMAGTCTTSGLGYKMRGRVGDSPIIGAGLFVDGEVGGCAATGLGEYVIKTQTSFLVVEFMRQGINPMEACKKALERVKAKYIDGKDFVNFQIGLIAMNVNGDIGGYSIYPGFNYALYQNGENKMIDAPYLLENKIK